MRTDGSPSKRGTAMPGVPSRFKTEACTKCQEPITDTQFEQCLGFCETCHKNYIEGLLDDEKDPIVRDRLLADIAEASAEFAEDQDGPTLDPEDQDIFRDR
jgi:hypothetical protein